MKKILSLIAAVLLALTAFASCSKKNDKLVVAVPNDATNEARALLLLEKQGYIKLKEDAGITATVRDIVENPYNLSFKEVEAAQLPNFLKDVDYAVINSMQFPQSSILLRIRLQSKVHPPHTATFSPLKKATKTATKSRL